MYLYKPGLSWFPKPSQRRICYLSLRQCVIWVLLLWACCITFKIQPTNVCNVISTQKKKTTKTKNMFPSCVLERLMLVFLFVCFPSKLQVYFDLLQQTYFLDYLTVPDSPCDFFSSHSFLPCKSQTRRKPGFPNSMFQPPVVASLFPVPINTPTCAHPRESSQGQP